MKGPFFRTLRGQLIMLVVLSLLPVLVIFTHTVIDRRDQVLKDAQENALLVVRDVAVQQRQIAESTRQLLMTLTKIPEVRDQNVGACNRLFEELLKENPLYADIFAADGNGIIFASGRPFIPYSVSQRKYFQDVLETKDFAVGEYVVGGVTKRPVLPFAYPILDHRGGIRGIVVAGFDLKGYGPLPPESGLALDSELELTDHRGVRLYTQPHHERFVGTTDSPDLFTLVRKGGDEGTFSAFGADGVKRLYAYRVLRLRENQPPYLYIRASIPERTALAHQRTVFFRNLIILGLSCLAALIAAWFIGSVIIRRQVTKLEEATRSLGLGDLGARTGLKYEEGELGQLAKAFDDMAAKLDQKEADRKTAEEELRESEERYRTAIEYSNDGVTLMEGDKHIYVNQRFVDIFGYSSPEELIGQSHSLTVHPDDFEMVSDINKRRQKGESVPARYEFKGVRKDGTTVYVEVSATKINYRGNPVSLAYLRDVTERRLSEKLLNEAEDKYRGIFENAIEGIFQSTPDGRFIAANPSLAKMYGFESPEELLETVTDMENQLYVNPEDRRRLQKLFAQEGFVSDFETELYRKDGSKIWITMSARAVRDAKEQEVFYEGRVEDITRKKQMEAALTRSEARYRDIFENAVEGIFQTTPDGRYLQVNPALAKMYGYQSPEDLMKAVTNIGQQVYVEPEARERLQETVSKQGFVEGFEAQQYRKDGSRIWTSSNARSVNSADGSILYYEGTVENITDRKHLESQLLQAQKMEAIGTLAGGIAHDFNNILSALIGYGNLLQMKMEIDDPLRIYVEHMLAASEKAANLTQSLLAFSRKQVIRLQPQKINAMVRDIEKILQRLLTEDIELKVTTSETDLQVMADLTQIDQVLLNLATNARDAMPKGGKLHIETGEATIDNEFIKIHGYGERGKYALISVSDTGSGMDEKTREKIFEPFFTTKEVGKGTGLGLSIVYGIVKQHNGYINVSSEAGRGTTFHIYLPTVRTAAEETVATVVDIKGGTETILLAEDNADLRRLVREVLISKGYTTIEAVDGENAVEQFMEHQGATDLLVLDVVMPKKNGKEVYDAIRNVRPDIKVLFTSGYTGDVVIDKGIYDGAVEFIQKPLTPNELLRKIREVLDANHYKTEN